MFPEVKQNWLGFSLYGNGGSGLGRDFARPCAPTCRRSCGFRERDDHAEQSSRKGMSGQERRWSGHDQRLHDQPPEDWLCRYTEEFAVGSYRSESPQEGLGQQGRFNYETESWERGRYDLPWLEGDFVLLTPKDMLTRDENWINRTDMIRDFESIPVAIPDAELRGQVFNYFQRVWRSRDRQPSQKDGTRRPSKR